MGRGYALGSCSLLQKSRYVFINVNTCNENLDFVDRVVGGGEKFCARDERWVKYEGGQRKGNAA